MLVTIEQVKPGDYFTVPQDRDRVRYRLTENWEVERFPGDMKDGRDAVLDGQQFVGRRLQLVIPLW